MSYHRAMASTLGFCTQRELDVVVGNTRRRERLEAAGILPRGRRVKTYGQRFIIFPEFVAAALILQRRSEADGALLAQLRRESEQLYGSKSFQSMAEVLRTGLHNSKGWTLTSLVQTLLDRTRDDLLAWRAEVTEAERRLAELGILTSFNVGRIEEVTKLGYRIALADSQNVVTCALDAARSRLPAGSWVTHDLIEVGARKGEVLVPTVDPGIMLDMRDALAAQEDAALWDDMLGRIDYQPIAVPDVRESGDFASSDGDLVRPKRRLRVRLDRSLYADANTMARSRRVPETR